MKKITGISTFLLLAANVSAENYHYSSPSNHPYSSQSNREENTYSQDMYNDDPYNQDMSDVTLRIANNPKLGKILTDDEGMTLYIFTPDKNNTSTCYDQCAIDWPPLLISSDMPTLAPGIAGKLGTIKRHDNSSQVTYNRMPLYYYVKDKKPGDVYGQNVDKKWFVINPDKQY